ncbi:MAG: SBBP repeat-containing protein, partial [bacterium]
MKKVLTVLSVLFLLNQADSQVTQEWAARYNGPPGNNSDFAYAMALDGSGNVYVTGYSVGIGTGSYDYATVKYNSSGVQQWVSRYNGTANGTDYAYAIAVDSSGNVYVTGGSVGIETNYYDYATVKYDASGILQWVRRYDLGGGDIASLIAVDGSGNIYVSGYSLGSGTGDDYLTIKYNSSGSLIWVARYTGVIPVGYERPYALVLD